MFKPNLIYLSLDPIPILDLIIRSELIVNHRKINLDISYNIKGLRI